MCMCEWIYVDTVDSQTEWKTNVPNLSSFPVRRLHMKVTKLCSSKHCDMSAKQKNINCMCCNPRSPFESHVRWCITIQEYLASWLHMEHCDPKLHTKYSKIVLRHCSSPGSWATPECCNHTCNKCRHLYIFHVVDKSGIDRNQRLQLYIFQHNNICITMGVLNI